MTSASTSPFSRYGVPTVMFSPSAIIRTWSSLTVLPVSISIFSSFRVCPSATRYCFPPFWMTAYMSLLQRVFFGSFKRHGMINSKFGFFKWCVDLFWL